MKKKHILEIIALSGILYQFIFKLLREKIIL